MRISILPAALEDLALGYEFYEKQEGGAGANFQESIFEEIDVLAETGVQHTQVFDHYRLVCHRFPYAIYYLMEDGALIVARVLDCRRSPKWIRKQFE